MILPATWFLIAQAASFLASLAYGAKQARKAKKRLNQDREDPLYTTANPLDRLGVVYGTRRVGGIRVGVFSKVIGRDNYLYAVYAVSHGPVAGIKSPLMDGKDLENTIVEYGLGSHIQHAGRQSSILQEIPEFWDLEDGALKGVAYAVIRMKSAGLHSVFGEFTFLVSGRQIFNPFTGVTKYTENPALCLLDYWTNKIYGARVDYSDLDMGSFEAAATLFDTPSTSPYASVATESSAVYGPVISGGATTYPVTSEVPAGVLIVSKGAYESAVVGVYYAVPGREGTSKVVGKKIILATNTPEARDRYASYLSVDTQTDAILWLYAIEVEGVIGKELEPDAVVLTPSATKYSCNGLVDCAKDVFENTLIITNTFGGSATFVNGKGTILPDEAASPVMHIPESILVGEVTAALPDATTKFNKVTASYFDPNKEYNSDTKTVSSAEFLAMDNGVVNETSIDLTLCDNAETAQRLATKLINKSRHNTPVELTTHWHTLQCTVNDVVTVSHEHLGWVEKLVRVVRIGVPNYENDVKLVVIPYDADDYLDLEINLSPLSNSVQVLDTRHIEAVSNLGFTYLPQSKEFIGKLTWDAPTIDVDVKSSWYVVEIGETSGSLFSAASSHQVRFSSGPVYQIPRGTLVTGEQYTFRVSWRSEDGIKGVKYAQIIRTINTNQAPTSVVVVDNTSPYGVQAEASYPATVTEQVSQQLTHLWYVAEYLGFEPAFASALLVHVGSSMSYSSGLKPGTEYRLWVKTVYGDDTSDRYPSGNGIPFTTAAIKSSDISDIGDTINYYTSNVGDRVDVNEEDIVTLFERVITDSVNIGEGIRDDADRVFEINNLQAQIDALP